MRSLTLARTKLIDSDLEPLRELRLGTLILTPADRVRDRRLSGVGVAAVVKGMTSLTALSVEGVPMFPRMTATPDNPFGKSAEPRKDGQPGAATAAARKQKAEVVAALRTLTKLRRLNLLRSGVTDEDVEWVKEMKTLEYLYLDQKVSAAAVDKLKQGLPGCTIARSLRSAAQFGNEPAK